VKDQKRKNILDAATKLFAKKGFEITTTREIARAAHISNAALYYYFDNKENLLYQILDDTITTGLELIKRIGVSQKTPKRNYLQSFGCTHELQLTTTK
jgi:AcrR family transcriptional regulator